MTSPFGNVLVAVAVAASALCGCSGPPPDGVRIVAVSAATAEQPQPVLGAAGEAAVRAGVESDRGRFTLVVAGLPDRTVTLDLVARRERAGRPEVEHGPRRGELVDALVADARRAVGAIAAPTGEPNLLQAIADGARGAPGTLLVLDSGIATADPVDLGAWDWAADPVVIAEDLRDRNALPELRGWEVDFVGLGRVAGHQPALDLPQQRWLERLWTTVCATAGARRCTVDPSVASVDPPLSTRSVPAVGIPQMETLSMPDGSVDFTFPDARLGFGPGSAELASEAGAVLQPVVDAFPAGGTVRVTGVVAFWGDEGYRQRLSSDRAAAVARWLVAHGLPERAVEAVGVGAVDGMAASTTNGRFDERKVTKNGVRRVVVTLSQIPPTNG